MAGYDFDHISPPLSDPRVDRLQDLVSSSLDEFPALSIDIPDQQIIKNLEGRIQDSKAYWNKPDGFNLQEVRNQNGRMYIGRQIDINHLYRFQVPYVENQIYIAAEAILAYTTAKNPEPEVYPAQDTPTSKIFAKDLEKVMMAHSEKFDLQRLVDVCVQNLLVKQVGFIYLEYDPYYGDNGEIVPMAVDPEHVIVDKNARLGHNPEFICQLLKMNVNEMCRRWPGKQKEIYAQCGIVRGTSKQLEQIQLVRQVWITHYDKSYEAHEAVVYYFGSVVLEKDRNPNWLYATKNKNFLPFCKKPFIPLNFDNDGSHWVDMTGPVQQASMMQNVLNKRGRQLMEVADKANGLLIVSSDSGLTKDDMQNLTGDPNQRLIIKTAGMRTQDLVYQVPPPVIPPFLFQDKQDQRMQIGNLMGAPTDFTGSNSEDNGGDETLGQSVMRKNQASGRQDRLVRAIDRFMSAYFNYLVQMMVVWYDEKHLFVYNGGDGEFDHIVMSRDLIEDGIAVTVKSGSTLPFDKARQEAVALQMAKMGLLAPLDVYKMLHMPNPQQLYDNYAKFKTDPQNMARNALDELDNNKAYMAFTDIMNGKKAEEPDDCTTEFVLSLRKLMLRDEFLKAKPKYQAEFINYVSRALQSLEMRMNLDQLGQQDLQALDPTQPAPPAQPPQQPTQQPPMGMPGAPMAPQTLPMPGGMPMGAPGVPPGGVLGGMPAPQLPPPGMVPGAQPPTGLPVL